MSKLCMHTLIASVYQNEHWLARTSKLARGGGGSNVSSAGAMSKLPEVADAQTSCDVGQILAHNG